MESAPRYNAAADLIERNLAAGRGAKTAFIDDRGRYSYADLAERVDRFANLLRRLGVHPEQRILLCLHDGIDFPTAFLGAIKAGIVPVAVNTQLSADEFAFMLADSRARIVMVSAPVLPAMKAALAMLPKPAPEIIVSGAGTGREFAGRPARRGAGRCRDRADPSGRALLLALFFGLDRTAEGHGASPCEPDRDGANSMRSRCSASAKATSCFPRQNCFSPTGSATRLTFPMAVGATSVLTAERPTPAVVARILREFRPTIFCGVPTLYNAMLAGPDLPRREELALAPLRFGRRAVAAGNRPALVAADRRRHPRRHRLDRDAAHLPQQPARRCALRHHRQARARLRAQDPRRGGAAGPARRDSAICWVNGPTGAAGYWNNRERSQATFIGAWTRTGDKYFEDDDGYYVYCGRSDDMLKVNGMYVSPAEVEAALIAHDEVLEAAVVGAADADGLIKPKAFVVAKPGIDAAAELARALEAHAKTLLAPFKCPRWIVFLDELPKTATGKIQRFKLRDPPAIPR